MARPRPNWSELAPTEKWEKMARSLRPDMPASWLKEYPFAAPLRKWRFDYAWPKQRVAVEIDGTGVGHYSISGRVRDNEKQNFATSTGWRVFRYSTPQVATVAGCAECVEQVWEALCKGENHGTV